MKVNILALEWLENKKQFVKLSTYSYYKTVLDKHILPCFGDLDINSLNEGYIQKIIFQWQNGDIGKQKLQISTIRNMVMVLKQCIKYAQKVKHINIPEFSVRYVPKNNLSPIKIFDNNMAKQLRNAALSDFSFKSLGIILSISCGIRIGELCALQWKDIDTKRQLLKISKTLQRVSVPQGNSRTQIIISTPKTITSIREIPLPQNISDLIQTFSIHNKEHYILTNREDAIEPRTYRRFFNKFLQKHNIDNLNFHCLRHTFVTKCIESGADVKSVSELLGHATINTTLNMYVHPSMERKRECLELIKW